MKIQVPPPLTSCSSIGQGGGFATLIGADGSRGSVPHLCWMIISPTLGWEHQWVMRRRSISLQDGSIASVMFSAAPCQHSASVLTARTLPTCSLIVREFSPVYLRSRLTALKISMQSILSQRAQASPLFLHVNTLTVVQLNASLHKTSSERMKGYSACTCKTAVGCLPGYRASLKAGKLSASI